MTAIPMPTAVSIFWEQRIQNGVLDYPGDHASKGDHKYDRHSHAYGSIHLLGDA
jgi:hypothetical protein